MIPVPDWLLVSIQWVHHMGAVAWVGGSIFFRFVLQPAFRKAGIGRDSARTIGQEFGRIVRIAILILIVTGAFMAVVHLSAGGNSRLYIGILALKITLAFYMFLLVWLRRRSPPSENAGGPGSFWRRFRRAITGTTALLILGVVVIGLADVLGAVHDSGGHAHGSDGHSEVMESNGHDHGEDGDEAETQDGHDHAEDSDEAETQDGHDHAEDGDEAETQDGHDHTEDADGDEAQDAHDHTEDDDGAETQDAHDHAEDEVEDSHDHGHAGDSDEDESQDAHDHSHAEDDDGDEAEDSHGHDHDEDDDGDEDEDGHDDGHDHSH